MPKLRRTQPPLASTLIGSDGSFVRSLVNLPPLRSETSGLSAAEEAAAHAGRVVWVGLDVILENRHRPHVVALRYALGSLCDSIYF